MHTSKARSTVRVISNNYNKSSTYNMVVDPKIKNCNKFITKQTNEKTHTAKIQVERYSKHEENPKG